MKTSIHPNYVNLLKDVLTKHSVILINNDKRKSKDSAFIQKVTFEINTYKPPILQYNLFFIHRLVFDPGIPVYYIITPSVNINLKEKSYYKLLTQMFKRSGYIKI